jgi:hypothetical protein
MRTLKDKKISEIDDKIIMTEPTLLFPDYMSISQVFDVDSYYAGRIDLISLSVYNSADYVDQLLKFNGISNPFSIAEGDVLYIPPIDVLRKTWKKPGIGTSESNVVRDRFVETKRLPIKDQNRLDYLKRKAALKPNGAKEILPPNVLASDEKNVIIENGTLTVGAALPSSADRTTALSSSADRTTALLTSNKAFPGEIQKINTINTNNTNNNA